MFQLPSEGVHPRTLIDLNSREFNPGPLSQRIGHDSQVNKSWHSIKNCDKDENDALHLPNADSLGAKETNHGVGGKLVGGTRAELAGGRYFNLKTGITARTTACIVSAVPRLASEVEQTKWILFHLRDSIWNYASKTCLQRKSYAASSSMS